MYYLETTAAFDSAHFLSGYTGKCANLHGHRWTVTVQIQGTRLQTGGQERGMLLDFGSLKAAVRRLADELDHALLYERDTLRQQTVAALQAEGFRLIELPFRPTAEELAHYFYTRLHAQGFALSRVTVHETPENCAVYVPEGETENG